MWQRMVMSIDSLAPGSEALGILLADLRGLFVEANPHDALLQDEFAQLWNEIEMEYELRTEAWAPAGSADDRRLASGLAALRRWAASTLAHDASSDHN